MAELVVAEVDLEIGVARLRIELDLDEPVSLRVFEELLHPTEARPVGRGWTPRPGLLQATEVVVEVLAGEVVRTHRLEECPETVRVPLPRRHAFAVLVAGDWATEQIVVGVDDDARRVRRHIDLAERGVAGRDRSEGGIGLRDQPADRVRNIRRRRRQARGLRAAVARDVLRHAERQIVEARERVVRVSRDEHATVEVEQGVALLAIGVGVQGVDRPVLVLDPEAMDVPPGLHDRLLGDAAGAGVRIDDRAPDRSPEVVPGRLGKMRRRQRDLRRMRDDPRTAEAVVVRVDVDLVALVQWRKRKFGREFLEVGCLLPAAAHLMPRCVVLHCHALPVGPQRRLHPHDGIVRRKRRGRPVEVFDDDLGAIIGTQR